MKRPFVLGLLALLLTGCAMPRAPAPASVIATASQANFARVKFADLPGWATDPVLEAKPAMVLSCRRILRKMADDKQGRVTAGDWQPFCRDLLLQPDRDEAGFRSLLDTHLQPYAVTDNGRPEGLFTGYYEAALNGARKPHGAYRVPLYKRPSDLVMVDLGQFRDAWKGLRTAGRVVDGKLTPYADRAKIVDGALKNRNLELVWLDNAADAFFVQVQGSGRVRLDTGQEIRIGYDGQNGHVYTAIGKELLKRGELRRDEVSMGSIRDWLSAHPDQAAELMNLNHSYVFFRETPLGKGPVGGEGVALTPGRSLAVDTKNISYGTPVWLTTETPDGQPFERLMVAQDTGGAITGVVRGDIFWGFGPEAEKMAGPMKSPGRYFVLMPKTVDVASPSAQ